MKIETKYNYEKTWQLTNEKDLLKMIEEEIGALGAEGTLQYIKATLKNGKELSVGSCKFRMKKD